MADKPKKGIYRAGYSRTVSLPEITGGKNPYVHSNVKYFNNTIIRHNLQKKAIDAFNSVRKHQIKQLEEAKLIYEKREERLARIIIKTSDTQKLKKRIREYMTENDGNASPAIINKLIVDIKRNLYRGKRITKRQQTKNNNDAADKQFKKTIKTFEKDIQKLANLLGKYFKNRKKIIIDEDHRAYKNLEVLQSKISKFGITNLGDFKSAEEIIRYLGTNFETFVDRVLVEGFYKDKIEANFKYKKGKGYLGKQKRYEKMDIYLEINAPGNPFKAGIDVKSNIAKTFSKNVKAPIEMNLEEIGRKSSSNIEQSLMYYLVNYVNTPIRSKVIRPKIWNIIQNTIVIQNILRAFEGSALDIKMNDKGEIEMSQLEGTLIIMPNEVLLYSEAIEMVIKKLRTFKRTMKGLGTFKGLEKSKAPSGSRRVLGKRKTVIKNQYKKQNDNSLEGAYDKLVPLTKKERRVFNKSLLKQRFKIGYRIKIK